MSEKIKLKPDTPVLLDPLTIYNDLESPIIIVRGGFVVIPEFHNITEAKLYMQWISVVNKEWDGKILLKFEGKKQYVAIPTTIADFLDKLPEELKKITKIINNPEEMNDILDGKKKIGPTEEEIEKLVHAGLIAPYKKVDYGEEEELEDDEEKEEDTSSSSTSSEDSPSSLEIEICDMLTAATCPSSPKELAILKEVSAKIVVFIIGRLLEGGK